VLPLRVARLLLLADPLGLGRALHPLLQRVSSRIRQALEEEATVHNFAELQLPVPVLRGAPERRLELAVVLDEHPSTIFWQPLLQDLVRLLARHGAFRDLRIWRLETDADGAARLWPGLHGGTPRSLRVLRSARAACRVGLQRFCGRRVATRLLSRPGCLPYHLDVLAHWLRRQPVVLLHLMSPEQWRHTALGCAELLWLRAAPPASSDAAARLLPDTDLGSERGDASPIAGLILPVIGADACSLSAWARILTGHAGTQVRGARFPRDSDSPGPPCPTALPRTPREWLRRFMAGASGPARALALACAAVPLTLPVVWLVQ